MKFISSKFRDQMIINMIEKIYNHIHNSIAPVVKNRLIAHFQINDVKRQNERCKYALIGTDAIKLCLWLGLTKKIHFRDFSSVQRKINTIWMYVIMLLRLCICTCVHKHYENCYFLGLSNFPMLLFFLHSKSFYRSCLTHSLKKISNGLLASFVLDAGWTQIFENFVKKKFISIQAKKTDEITDMKRQNDWTRVSCILWFRIKAAIND